MKKKGKQNVKPWCPFCGMDVGRTRDAQQRKMTEFPVGRCECGAVYVCDATGHNVGAAIVECLVYACGDDWDLAWNLVPEDDYLTGRIDNYDELTHQVVPTRELDGRWVRGVLYFVRLHRDVAEVAERIRDRGDRKSIAGTAGQHGGSAAPLPKAKKERKQPKKRASKQLVGELVAAGDIDALAEYCFDDRRTLRFMQRLLYDPDEALRYRTAWIIGQVCAQVSSREPGPVADLMHRLFDACSDSAATSWGMVEAIGSIIAARPDIYGAFTRYLLTYLGDASTREQVVWALGEIAGTRPELVRKIPFYATLPLLGDDRAVIRGLMARMLGRIRATEAVMQLMGLQNDENEITYFEQGLPVRTTVAHLATEAVQRIHNKEGAVNE
jgi:hypothetical protein